MTELQTAGLRSNGTELGRLIIRIVQKDLVLHSCLARRGYSVLSVLMACWLMSKASFLDSLFTHACPDAQDLQGFTFFRSGCGTGLCNLRSEGSDDCINFGCRKVATENEDLKANTAPLRTLTVHTDYNGISAIVLAS